MLGPSCGTGPERPPGNIWTSLTAAVPFFMGFVCYCLYFRIAPSWRVPKGDGRTSVHGGCDLCGHGAELEPCSTGAARIISRDSISPAKVRANWLKDLWEFVGSLLLTLVYFCLGKVAGAWTPQRAPEDPSASWCSSRL